MAAGLLCSVIAGLGVAPMLASQFSLVGTLALAGAATEAFTWHRAATVGGIACGSAVGGALVDGAGSGGAFALGCTAATLAYALAALGSVRIEPLAHWRPEAANLAAQDAGVRHPRGRVRLLGRRYAHGHDPPMAQARWGQGA
jgi:hypothetical protein